MDSEKSKLHLEKILNENIIFFTSFETQRNLEKVFDDEENRKKAYHGRELFELIQNIDDALVDNDQEDEAIAYIHYDINKKVIYICNNGTVFDRDSVERLCQGGVSGKEKKTYIGNKGIGFRSVLNWASKINIYSGDYSFGFSKEYASEQFNKIKDKEIIKKQLNKKPNLSFPVLSAPYFIDPDQKKHLEKTIQNFSTIIELFLNDDINDDFGIIKQIEEFDEKTILFLPNIKKINFVYDNNEKTISRECADNNKIVVKIEHVGKEDSEDYEYYLFLKEIELDNKYDRLLKMAIAVPNNDLALSSLKRENHLYTFFPIRNSECPFNVLMHATFDLNESRDSINPGDTNKRILQKLLSFFVDCVSEHFCKPEYNSKAVELLSPVDFHSNYSFPLASGLHEYKLEEYFLNILNNKKILYSVDGNFYSQNDTIYFYNDELPKQFNNTVFERLIKNSDINYVNNFLSELIGDKKYELKELIEKLNSIVNECPIKDKVNTFYWWNKNNGFESDKLPKLLKYKNEEKYIEKRNDACFLSGGYEDIPKWANIALLDPEYEKELLTVFKSKNPDSFENKDVDKRNLARLIKSANIQEQSSKISIISPINNSIKEDYTKSTEFLVWLWKQYTLNESMFDDSDRLNDITYSLPSDDEKVCKADFMFFGEDYGNIIGKCFFKNEKERKKIISFDKIRALLPEIDVNKFRTFLQRLGVLEYPKIKKRTINSNKLESYLNYLRSKNKIEDFSNWYETVNVDYIEGLDKILEESDTELILCWIFKCDDLKSILLSNKESDNSAIQYWFPRAKYYPRKYNDGIRKFRSYIGYVFYNQKWISINNNKYSPFECILEDDSRINQFCNSVISSQLLKEWASRINYYFGINISSEDIRFFFVSFGIVQNICDFPPKLFYNLLLKIQNDDSIESKRIAEKIYRQCSKELSDFHYEELKQSDCNEKKKFFDEGKVYAKNKEVEEFHSINDTFFSSTAVLNLSNKFLMITPSRSGSSERIKDIFNVKKFVEEYSLTQEPNISNINKDFEDNFKDLVLYVACYRDKDVPKLKNISVKLVSNIVVNNIAIIEKYTLVKGVNNKNWFIYVADDSKINYSGISLAIKQILNVVLDFPSDDFLSKMQSWFIQEPSVREKLYYDDFGKSGQIEIIRKRLIDDICEEKKIINQLDCDNIILSEDLKTKLNSIDFSQTDNIYTQENIYHFLKAIGKDVDYFKRIKDFPKISILPYLNKKYEYFKKGILEDLWTRVYGKVIEEEKKQEYISTRNIFENNFFADAITNDTVNCNYCDNYKNFCEKNRLNESNLKWVDIENTFKGNVNSFKEKYKSSDSALIDSFIEKNRSLFYFEVDINDIGEKLKSYQTTDHSNTNEIIITPEDINRVNSFSIQSIENIKQCNSFVCKTKPIYTGTHVIKPNDKSDKNKQRNGDLAEKAVFEKINGKKFKEITNYFGNEEYQVKWVSGAARRINNNPEVNDGLGYDIEISDNCGRVLYIEVKSTEKSDCYEFNFSENEYTFAKKNHEKYRIVFVSEISSKSGKITFIDKDIFDPIFCFEPSEYKGYLKTN